MTSRLRKLAERAVEAGRAPCAEDGLGSIVPERDVFSVSKIASSQVWGPSTHLSAFVDELQKLASISQEQVGVAVTDDPKRFVSKLRPGDILMTRSDTSFFSRLVSTIQKIRGVSGSPAEWSHVGLYVGDGQMRHSHLPVSGGGLGLKVRDHSVEKVFKRGVDFLALRPMVSRKDKTIALERSKDLVGKRYSTHAALKAGLLPGIERKSTSLKKSNLPESVICTSVAGYSYPKIQFGPPLRSIHSLLPSEIASSAKLRPVAALSSPKE